MGNLIFTIGREYGSGGLEIGRKLAQRLGVKCYDSELLKFTSKESGYCEEVLQANDEKPSNGFFSPIAIDSGMSMSGYAPAPFLELPLNHKVFLAQFEAIQKLAEQESCVIVGRCADYALMDHEELVSVFIHADIIFRKNRLEPDLAKDYKDEKRMIDQIHKTDRKRANYYNYFSNKKWGESRSYNLCIDSSLLGIDGCVDLILDYAKIRGLMK